MIHKTNSRERRTRIHERATSTASDWPRHRHSANAALDADGQSYVYLGRQQDDIRMSEWGVFAQDQWRINSGLTLNAGLRYQTQLAVTPGISSYLSADLTALCGISGTGSGGGAGTPDCNMFMPGVLTGKTSQYTLFEPGTATYPADRNNFAPNVGVAWRPMVEDGFWRSCRRTRSKPPARAGFSVVQSQYAGLLDVFTANPGRSPRRIECGQQQPGSAGPSSWLFSDTARLAPATCSGAVTSACYPAALLSCSGNDGQQSVFDPNLHESFSRQSLSDCRDPLTATWRSRSVICGRCLVARRPQRERSRLLRMAS
jgi:hypothetical protein